MASQTKMIIITSDEDIIRQFAFNKTKNKHIIDMDNNNKIISIETNDNNTINLNFVSDLTRNDQVYKRSVDITDHNQSKPVKTRKKSTDLICTICGDRAIGYNYAVLSCASCKAFFHRNGLQDLKRFKCLTDHGQCVIDHKISRKCYRCRLERCLTIGMRKDLILSQEEVQRRKDAGRNRNISSTKELTNSLSNSETVLPTFDEIDRLFMDMNEDNDKSINPNEVENILLEPLTIEDLEVINSIQSSFLSIIENKCDELPNVIDLFTHESELICCLQVNNEIALVIIEFCRVIDKFKNLNADDRFIMIKYNLVFLFCILTCYRPKETNDCSSDLDKEHEEAEEKRQMYILCNQSDYIYEMVTNLSVTFDDIIEQDRILVSLLLTIFLFSKGLSMNENEPLLKDSLSVYQAQSYYTKLLWNYMIKNKGEIETYKYFTKLVRAIFRAQLAALKFREFLGSQATTLDAVDEIAPLMQTILHIS